MKQLFSFLGLVMGCDGGTIPRRCEMVREKKKPEQKNKDQDMIGKWRHCALSGQPLVQPIMACGLGRLYNKEAVLTHLLESKGTSHLRKFSDVKELKLTPNPTYNPEVKADLYVDNYAAPYVCPIIGLEMSGRYRFVYNVSCGCVLSERAMIEIPSTVCHSCTGPLDENDITILNGTDEDVSNLTDRLLKKKEDAKSARKAKKNGEKVSSDKEKASNVDAAGTSVEDGVEAKADDVETDQVPKVKKSSKRAADKAENGKLKAKKQTISEDTTTSETYKNLFHSHTGPRSKDKTAHWVTYNPYYN